MKIYTLFLNTQNLSQIQYKPNKITANDSGSVYWGIDWDNLFGINHKYTTARVKFILKSKSGTSIVYFTNTDLSNLRCNLSTNFQNSINMCSLGFVEPNLDIINSANVQMKGDTTSTNGVSVIIPRGYSNFYLTMFNIDETISTIPDDSSSCVKKPDPPAMNLSASCSAIIVNESEAIVYFQILALYD